MAKFRLKQKTSLKHLSVYSCENGASVYLNDDEDDQFQYFYWNSDKEMIFSGLCLNKVIEVADETCFGGTKIQLQHVNEADDDLPGKGLKQKWRLDNENRLISKVNCTQNGSDLHLEIDSDTIARAYNYADGEGGDSSDWEFIYDDSKFRIESIHYPNQYITLSSCDDHATIHTEESSSTKMQYFFWDSMGELASIDCPGRVLTAKDCGTETEAVVSSRWNGGEHQRWAQDKSGRIINEECGTLLDAQGQGQDIEVSDFKVKVSANLCSQQSKT